MIDAEFVERLIRAVDESGVDTVEIRRGGTRVRISKTPPPAPVRTEAEAGPVAGAVESLASGDRPSAAPAEPPVAGVSATKCLLIECRCGSKSSMKSSRGCLTCRSYRSLCSANHSRLLFACN